MRPILRARFPKHVLSHDHGAREPGQPVTVEPGRRVCRSGFPRAASEYPAWRPASLALIGTAAVLLAGCSGLSDVRLPTAGGIGESGSSTPVTRLTLDHSSVEVEAGQRCQFTANFEPVDTASKPPRLTWTATGGTVTPDGLFTAGDSTGTFRVIVANRPAGAADTARIVVVAKLVRLRISPDTLRLTPGAIQSLRAVATQTDSGRRPVAVHWVAAGGTITETGVYTAGPRSGPFDIVGSLTDADGRVLADTVEADIGRTSATLRRLTVGPAALTTTPGATVQFTASGDWSDGSKAVPAVTWSATGGTIDASGSYTAGVAPGTFRATATQRGGTIVGVARITIAPARAISFVLAPDSARLKVGGRVQLTTSVGWSDRRVHPYRVSFTATGGMITSGGSYTAGSAAGKFLIIAACTCGLVDTASTTIAPAESAVVKSAPTPAAVVANLALAPATLDLFAGDSGHIAATLRGPDGTIQPGQPVGWTSSAPGVAAVSSEGAVLALSPGQAIITATIDGRSATATVVVTATTLRSLAAKRGLVMGTAAITAPFVNDPEYRQVLATQYNGLTPGNELKFGPVHPGPDQYNFARADRLVAFARAHGMTIHGHTLIWAQGVPGWVTQGGFTKAQLLAVMKNHIMTVVGRYRGEIASWDVVNEVVSWNGASGLQPGVWLNTIGPSYIDSAFVWAHAADPAAKLYLNDYGQEVHPAKADLILSLVEGLRSRGIPIDGVGFQTHLSDTPPSKATFQRLFARFADAGFDVRVSEMDQRVPDGAGPAALITQAVAYRDVLDACLEVSRCTGFTTWGFTDRYSFVPISHPGFGRGLPLDSDYRAKPAFDSLAARLRRP